MRNAIKSGLLQVWDMKLFVGALIVGTLIFGASTESLVRFFRGELELPQQYHIDFIIRACKSDTLAAFIPIIATLPFSANYIDEQKSKYTHYLLVRCNYKEYIFSRVIVCFLAGGIVVTLGLCLAFMGALLLFYPSEIKAINSQENEPLLHLMQTILLYSLCGGFWSIVGMAMSTIMESKYISYATPFVLYYLLVILYERYFSDLFIIYPKTWTDPAAWPFGCWGAAIFLLEMTLIFAILFAYRAGRRLQQL